MWENSVRNLQYGPRTRLVRGIITLRRRIIQSKANSSKSVCKTKPTAHMGHLFRKGRIHSIVKGRVRCVNIKPHRRGEEVLLSRVFVEPFDEFPIIILLQSEHNTGTRKQSERFSASLRHVAYLKTTDKTRGLVEDSEKRLQ